MNHANKAVAAPSRVNRSDEVAASVDGVEVDPRPVEDAAQLRDVHVEHIATGGCAIRPGASRQRVSADDRVLALEQRRCESGLDRRQHDEATSDSQHPVLDGHRSGATV